MPTPKQVREHYKKIRYHFYRLSTALHKAHAADVIVYPNNRYEEEGPCRSLEECRIRVEKTTEKARAEALRIEVMRELKGFY